ncbi:MAG: hypothetical protein U0269_37905 [Polyangiales bacterium]
MSDAESSNADFDNEFAHGFSVLAQHRDERGSARAWRRALAQF